jgi:hypothetical protein
MNNILLRLAMILLIATATTLTPKTRAEQEPTAIPVIGQSDWLIIPPQIPSEYVTFHPDGGLTIKDMPLKGNFHLTGDGVELEGFGLGILNAEIDADLNGPIYGPLTVTEVIKGKEKVIFQGAFFGTVTQLRASGQIVLQGRGHCAGMSIAVSYLETDNNTEVFNLTGDLFDRNSK